MTHCPDSAQLELLLDNRLADTERDELELHVEGCAACQQTLEELTDATMWDQEPRQGAVITPTDAYAGLVVDPLGVTAGATAGANERVGRGAPAVVGGMRSRASWAAAEWVWSTRRATSGSTAPAHSR